MCMNLQAEGMSNVLEHVVNTHCEVSKSLRARTKKGKCRNPQFHNVILKTLVQHLSSLKDPNFLQTVTTRFLSCVKAQLLSMNR